MSGIAVAKFSGNLRDGHVPLEHFLGPLENCLAHDSAEAGLIMPQMTVLLWSGDTDQGLAAFKTHGGAAVTVGGEPPQRVVGVWLICLSPFQRAVADWDCRQIVLRGPGKVIPVGV
jgi:hypothetical protein